MSIISFKTSRPKAKNKTNKDMTAILRKTHSFKIPTRRVPIKKGATYPVLTQIFPMIPYFFTPKLYPTPNPIKNNAKTVYNLTNTDYVYDKDPKKSKSAKPLKHLKWGDYLKLIGKWKSGLHSPFDPIASAKAKKHRLKVVILNGKKLNNLHRAISGKSFVGTVIE